MLSANAVESPFNPVSPSGRVGTRPAREPAATPQAVRRAPRLDVDVEEYDEGVVLPLRTWYVPVKRCADCVLASALLVLALPVVLVAGLLIKLTSHGPVFYRQIRLGINGRPFKMVKLRTMRNNAESTTGPVWSTANDSRVTAVGLLLRQTHVDEFAQLWNVLRGEMSLIGPRPERPEFVAQLAGEIPFYCERMRVRPGITGLAQLRLPPDSDLDSVRDKLVHDVYYVRHLSPFLDLKLLFLTGARLTGDICRLVSAALVLPGSTAIEEGFFQAVGLASPMRTDAYPVTVAALGGQSELVEMHPSTE